MLDFRGTAHGHPSTCDGGVADLSAAEIRTTQLGKNGGVPLLYEHDRAQAIGRVLSSWEGTEGQLRVSGVISDHDAAARVRSGEARGLSLGTALIQDERGGVLSRVQDEVSLCVEPRRSGCYIDTVDGHNVLGWAAASASRRAPPAPRAPPARALSR